MNFLIKLIFLLIVPLISIAGSGDDIGKMGVSKDVQKVIRVQSMTITLNLPPIKLKLVKQ